MKSAITLTDSAKTHILNTLNQMDKPYLVFGLKGGGCAGFEYFWIPATEDEYQKNGNPTTDELISLDETKKFVVDSTSLVYLFGSTIDSKNDFISSQLTVDNPNDTSSCGCGTSIAV
jgi:iron-sulfur cluster assembly protein